MRPVRALPVDRVQVGDVIRWGPRKRWALVTARIVNRPLPVWRMRWAFGNDAGQLVTVPDQPGGYVVVDKVESVIAKDPQDAAEVRERMGWT